MAADLDYENAVADIVDSVDDLAAALDDDKVDYYYIADEEVLADVDDFVVVFHHLQVAQHQQPGEEGESYHLIKMVWHIPMSTASSFR